MRRVIRTLVDFAALWAIGGLAWSAHGPWYGVLAMVATGAYSCWCFVDGMTA
jgi:hypothetical protein